MIDLKSRIVRPRCARTCGKYNYLKKENEGKLQVYCDKCRDRQFCCQTYYRGA